MAATFSNLTATPGSVGAGSGSASVAPIILGISAGTSPVLQPGSRFSNRTYGLDDGKRTFLVHPNYPSSKWPKAGKADGDNPSMYVVDVTDSDDPSSLVILEVTYKGIAGKKPDRITPDSDVQMITLPVYPNGASANMILPMPQPRATREYVSTVQPTYQGVGAAISATWLPQPPAFSLSFVPDPNKPPTINYFSNQWVLQGRTWDAIIPNQVWLVRERVAYFYSLASA